MNSYEDVLNGKKECSYLICKKIPVDFGTGNKDEKLWKEHDAALDRTPEKNVRFSLLDLKIKIAGRIFSKCHFCEHDCMVDRRKERGKCGVGKASIASEFLHYGEERMLIPSHTIFFSGCPFHCVFCQNWGISQRQSGIYIEPERLAYLIGDRKGKNVNWVGGEPTPNLPYILETLKECELNMPQIWNSNMYCSIETMKLLDGVMDVYLTDFKYGNDKCAERLSKIKNYWEVITRNHLMAYDQGDVIVRHLVMPNHIECCSFAILKWIAGNIPHAIVNIMDQYRPEYMANQHSEIARRITVEEYEKVCKYGKKLGLRMINPV
ncbi:MAG: radical SAM protein [Candidatus Thermoplasmatota archaeon]|nr:radical SAM protein [Candidatus Thermoplasmatota archaeon]